VDLKEVTFIDKTGERLLRVLREEGAQFISGECRVRHIVEQLKFRRKCKISNLPFSYFGPGDFDTMFDLLEKGFQEQDPSLRPLLRSQALDVLRPTG
jgi:hypothetical protein